MKACVCCCSNSLEDERQEKYRGGERERERMKREVEFREREVINRISAYLYSTVCVLVCVLPEDRVTDSSIMVANVCPSPGISSSWTTFVCTGTQCSTFVSIQLCVCVCVHIKMTVIVSVI